jgi:hypothetical protein
LKGLFNAKMPEHRLEAAADVLMNLALILVHSGSPVPAIARTEASGVVSETALDLRILLDNKIDRRPVGPFGESRSFLWLEQCARPVVSSTAGQSQVFQALCRCAEIVGQIRRVSRAI